MIMTGCMDVRREWKGTMDIKGMWKGRRWRSLVGCKMGVLFCDKYDTFAAMRCVALNDTV